jgi:pilus assembly protein CpaC
MSKITQSIIAITIFTISLLAYADDNLTIFVGEIKIIEVGEIERVAVGNSGILSTSMLDNGQLLLLAQSVGDTSVHIWYKDLTESELKISIVEKDQDRLLYEIQTLIDNIGDIVVNRVGEKLYLTGHIFGSDKEKLSLITDTYDGLIDLTKILPTPQAPVIFPNDKMVLMAVKLVELSKGLQETLGLQWDTTTGAFVLAVDGALGYNKSTFPTRPVSPTVNPGFGVTGSEGPLAFFGLSSLLTATLNIAVANSDALILAEPILSARSGSKAKFLAGGETPVTTAGGLGTTNVEYKQFGISIEMEPVIADNNDVLTKIITEASSIDPSLPAGAGVAPGFITRRTETDVRMKNNETLVLSGLIDRTLSMQVSKFPFLGDLPILGVFFRNTAEIDAKRELAVFITPTVMDSSSDINQSYIQKSNKLIDAYKSRNNILD